jgi:hypothetical protein
MAGSPIIGRIRDAPEGRCGPCEFHCNLGRSGRLLLYVDHAALFLFPAVYVLHDEPLLRRYFFRQGHQRTVRIDNQRLRPFRKLRAFLWGSVNDNWNGQFNPLAAPLRQPLFCVSELLVAHKTTCVPSFLARKSNRTGCKHLRESYVASSLAASHFNPKLPRSITGANYPLAEPSSVCEK